MEKENPKEYADLKALIKKARKEWSSFDYTIQVREGKIKRTILSEVYNGTDFDS